MSPREVLYTINIRTLTRNPYILLFSRIREYKVVKEKYEKRFGGVSEKRSELLSYPRAGFSVAAHKRFIPYFGFGNHAPTNADGTRGGEVHRVFETIPEFQGTREGAGSRGASRMAGVGLQPSGVVLKTHCRNCGEGAWREIAEGRGIARGVPWD